MSGTLVFAVAEARAAALAGDVGFVEHDGETVLVEHDGSRFTVEPDGLLPTGSPLIGRVAALLRRLSATPPVEGTS